MTRVDFLKNISELIAWAKNDQGIDLICFTFYRSPEQQRKEVDAGRSKLLWGRHQEWRAMDLAIVDDVNENGVVDKDEIRWNKDSRYQMLGEKWESMGGRWGGRWAALNDIYHFEG